ncbi:MAG TPA: hypothetical protein VM324_07450 [Egibacteraceae bacterium]|nr:hypothetical protein [Egibacteraceae bacterium]
MRAAQVRLRPPDRPQHPAEPRRVAEGARALEARLPHDVSGRGARRLDLGVPAEIAGPVHGPPDEIVERPPQTLEIVVGQTFDLTLATRIVPNHLWSVEVEGEAVEVTGQRLDEEAGEPRHVLSAVASAAGTAVLYCTYAKPWGSDARDTYTFTVHVLDA